MQREKKFWADLGALHAWSWGRIEFFARERWRNAGRPVDFGSWTPAALNEISRSVVRVA